MKRGLALVALAAIVLAAWWWWPPPQRPNVVLLIVDTLRADRLGCYGFPQATSREIDALAARGVRFERVIAQSSWTRPSIASTLTGLYPRSVGIYDEKWEALDTRFDTLAEILARRGYATYGATANPNINSVFGFDQGFDGYLDSEHMFDWKLPRAREVFDAVLERVRADPRRPYYLQLNVMDVHEHRTFDFVHPDPSLFAGSAERGYLEAVYESSVEIGRFVEALTALDGWEDTLFVITSDHGEGLGTHPDVPVSAGHGNLLYESNMIVPLILYRSGNRALPARSIGRPVRLMDLLPTLLDYLRIPVPEDLDGRSLLPLLRDPDASVALPEHFYVETEFREWNKAGLYGPEWKYIENRDGHPGLPPRELQRIGTAENGARTDRAATEPTTAEALARALHAWEAAVPRVAPSLLPDNAVSDEAKERLRSLGYLD